MRPGLFSLAASFGDAGTARRDHASAVAELADAADPVEELLRKADCAVAADPHAKKKANMNCSFHQRNGYDCRSMKTWLPPWPTPGDP